MNKVYSNVSEFTIEELIEYKKENPKQKIIIENPNKPTDNRDYYSIDDMIRIKEKINDILDSIPKTITEPDKEKKIFTYIYTRLAHMIKYDEYAAETMGYGGYDREMTEAIRENASNCYGGLIKGRSLCSGYSEILRNVIAQIGIESIYIYGEGKDGQGKHAWDQVKLDGKWYNVDLTNDRDNIVEGKECKFFLKSNKEFERYEQYDLISKTLHECEESYEKPNELMESYKYIRPIIEPKDIAEASKDSKVSTSMIKSILNKLFKKNKENNKTI